jgi:hypothetical protein
MRVDDREKKQEERKKISRLEERFTAFERPLGAKYR